MVTSRTGFSGVPETLISVRADVAMNCSSPVGGAVELGL